MITTKSYRILIVDDEKNLSQMLQTAFRIDGHDILTAGDGEAAVACFKQEQPDVVLMDIRMPKLDGIEALQQMRDINSGIPVILMTAYAAVETAVEALRLGAFDYVIKPFDLTELKLLISRALQLQEMKQEINLLHRELSASYQWGRMLTRNPKMMEICRDIAKVSRSQASVLITGESGTGKEVVARAIHYNSERAGGPFIKVNCGALPGSLLESELFGHEKGAFTGAQVQRQGLFERASGGTLLLDEVGEMPSDLQVKLLRVVQEKEFERVGGSNTIRVDLRIVAATNRDMDERVREGHFRRDLFYRLNVIHLNLPPLRERPEDIGLLASHFLQKFSQENNRDIIELAPETLALLTGYPWPGNVREISNVIERAVIMSTGFVIFLEDLPEQLLSQVRSQVTPLLPVMQEPGLNLKENIKAYEKELIISALAEYQNNKTHTASALGISRRALMYKLQEYNIE